MKNIRKAKKRLISCFSKTTWLPWRLDAVKGAVLSLGQRHAAVSASAPRGASVAGAHPWASTWAQLVAESNHKAPGSWSLTRTWPLGAWTAAVPRTGCGGRGGALQGRLLLGPARAVKAARPLAPGWPRVPGSGWGRMHLAWARSSTGGREGPVLPSARSVPFSGTRRPRPAVPGGWSPAGALPRWGPVGWYGHRAARTLPPHVSWGPRQCRPGRRCEQAPAARAEPCAAAGPQGQGG